MRGPEYSSPSEYCFARLFQQSFRSLKMSQRAGTFIWGPKKTEYAAKIGMYFAGVLLVPDLLVDFQRRLEVRQPLLAIHEVNAMRPRRSRTRARRELLRSS